MKVLVVELDHRIVRNLWGDKLWLLKGNEGIFGDG